MKENNGQRSEEEEDITWRLLYQGVQSSTIGNPSFLKAYLVEVTGTLPSVSPLQKRNRHAFQTI